MPLGKVVIARKDGEPLVTDESQHKSEKGIQYVSARCPVSVNHSAL